MNRPRLRRDGDRAWQFALALLAVTALVIGAIALLLHEIPTSAQFLIAATSFMHYPMWGVAVALVPALVTRRWIVSALAAVLTVLVVLVQAPAWVAATAPPHARTITIMQSNLKIGLADPARIVSLVRTHHVDLLAAEELTPSAQVGFVEAGLTKILRYHYASPIPNGASGLGIWSRYPISQPVAVPGFQLGVRHVRVAVPGGPITFGAVHLLAPYPEDPGGWRHEVGTLGTVIDELPADVPAVVAGDFNSTVDHAQFRDLLEHGWADAADQAGAGYPASFPADRPYGPLIAIDHVLTRDAVATSLDTYTVPGSDHRSLIVHVALPRNNG